MADAKQEQYKPTACLTLGDVLTPLGARQDPPIALNQIRVIRHSFTPAGHDGLRGRHDLTPERVLTYTRAQHVSSKKPEPYWVVFVADGKRRSRLFVVYHNRGEIALERTHVDRFFDLHPIDFLTSLAGRLVIDWDTPRVWHRTGPKSAHLPVLEIADRDRRPFPGFDRVLLHFDELRDLVDDGRYADWRAALESVQGIYLITDTSSGKHYVGKADGAERILGRWRAYATDGHGGNVALRELITEATGKSGVSRGDYARHFVFSLLRVFGPSTSPSEILAAERHYKTALQSQRFGLNRN